MAMLRSEPRSLFCWQPKSCRTAWLLKQGQVPVRKTEARYEATT